MKKSKISGNEITFTIPAEKANEIGVAAAQMVEGVENLKYSDVETKITIDKTTGKIDEILMDFQASMQYQGYDADMQYTVKYKFLSLDQGGAEETEQQKNEEESTASKGYLKRFSLLQSFVYGIGLVSVCYDRIISQNAYRCVDDQARIFQLRRIKRLCADSLTLLNKDTVAAVLASAHNKVSGNGFCAVFGSADHNSSSWICISF